MAAQKRRQQRQHLPTEQPDPNQETKAGTESDEQSTLMVDDYTHLDTIPGLHRVLISLTGKAWERSLIWRLDWMNFLYSPCLPIPTYLFDNE